MLILSRLERMCQREEEEEEGETQYDEADKLLQVYVECYQLSEREECHSTSLFLVE